LLEDVSCDILAGIVITILKNWWKSSDGHITSDVHRMESCMM
jgi:hypothetical protein